MGGPGGRAGEAHSCKGEASKTERNNWNCQGLVHLYLHGTQSWQGSPRWPTVHPSLWKPTLATIAFWGFLASHAWLKLSHASKTPKEEVEALCRKAWAEDTSCPPSSPSHLSSSLLRAPPQTPWGLCHTLGPISRETVSLRPHTHRVWCDPLGGTDDWGPQWPNVHFPELGARITCSGFSRWQ